MTVTTPLPQQPAEISERDRERALSELRRRFPGVMVWVGKHTMHWWAAICDNDGDRLIEAATPAELGRRLDAAGMRPHPPHQRQEQQPILQPQRRRLGPLQTA
ncbi:hypothetical protein Arub01_41760 [Actinomadura rubrobrunea]|uniref:Uncharacterized protein n=1 Tax=Actinomadura rubrobrunea TaxID=115335 RepID=A0A9W6PY40_9ACTN|nr:hypothetical protein Arub01_41760 [Actinomadura rubrobrunea]